MQGEPRCVQGHCSGGMGIHTKVHLGWRLYRRLYRRLYIFTVRSSSAWFIGRLGLIKIEVCSTQPARPYTEPTSAPYLVPRVVMRLAQNLQAVALMNPTNVCIFPCLAPQLKCGWRRARRFVAQDRAISRGTAAVGPLPLCLSKLFALFLLDVAKVLCGRPGV